MQLHGYAGMQMRGYVTRGYTVIGHVAFGVRRLGTYHSMVPAVYTQQFD